MSTSTVAATPVPTATGTAVPQASGAAALPVQLVVRGRVLDALRRTVEGQLGWQPVDDDTAGLVPAALRIADVEAEPAAVPTVLLVLPDDAPLQVAQAVHRLRPAAIAPWPVPPAELAGHAEVATRPVAARTTGALHLRLGGAGGGVGTTTVATALAGLCGWQGADTLLLCGDTTVLPDDAPAVEPSALTAPDLWARAAPVRGTERCRAVRTTAPPGEVDPVDPRIEVAISDLGVADDADVLVCAADARGLTALERTTAAAVVLVGGGPVPRREILDRVGRRRCIELPRSARVARAGALGRLPTSLPGSFVRPLASLLPHQAAARPTVPA